MCVCAVCIKFNFSYLSLRLDKFNSQKTSVDRGWLFWECAAWVEWIRWMKDDGSIVGNIINTCMSVCMYGCMAEVCWPWGDSLLTPPPHCLLFEKLWVFISLEFFNDLLAICLIGYADAGSCCCCCCLAYLHIKFKVDWPVGEAAAGHERGWEGETDTECAASNLWWLRASDAIYKAELESFAIKLAWIWYSVLYLHKQYIFRYFKYLLVFLRNQQSKFQEKLYFYFIALIADVIYLFELESVAIN